VTRDEAIAAIEQQVNTLGFRAAAMKRALAVLGPVVAPVTHRRSGTDLTARAREYIDAIADTREEYAEDEPEVRRDEVERATERAYEALEDLLGLVSAPR
jgi:hypothetical protein